MTIKIKRRGRFSSQKGSFVELSQISPYIQDAVIATKVQLFIKILASVLREWLEQP